MKLGLITTGLIAVFCISACDYPPPTTDEKQAAAEGTWVMLKDPNSDEVKAVYIEPRVVVSPFKLPNAECAAKAK